MRGSQKAALAVVMVTDGMESEERSERANTMRDRMREGESE